MGCHSIKVGRYLLSKPGEDYRDLKPIEVLGFTKTLKWRRPGYVEKLLKIHGVDCNTIPVVLLKNKQLNKD